jgi:hypothetical protein
VEQSAAVAKGCDGSGLDPYDQAFERRPDLIAKVAALRANEAEVRRARAFDEPRLSLVKFQQRYQSPTAISLTLCRRCCFRLYGTPHFRRKTPALLGGTKRTQHQ